MSERVFRLEDLGFELAHTAAFAKERHLANADVEVGSLELNDGLEEFVDEDRAWSHECKPLQAKVRPESAQKRDVMPGEPSMPTIIG